MKKTCISLLFMISIIFFTPSVFSQTVTDIDGNDYPTKNFNGNVWTVENANMEKYSDGTPIPQVTNNEKWAKLTTGAWCYIDNNPQKGKLYNWYAIAGIYDKESSKNPALRKKLAPKGWHVPTNDEWSLLKEYTAKSVASKKGWKKSDKYSTPGLKMDQNNETGFNAYPWGQRFTIASGGIFFGESSGAAFWTSTVSDGNPSGWVQLYYYHIGFDSATIASNNYLGVGGMSVRFVKDK